MPSLGNTLPVTFGDAVVDRDVPAVAGIAEGGCRCW